MKFALGFFGWPLGGQYLQSITVEEKGVRHESHLTHTLDVTVRWCTVY